jgi:hypothetical protein
MNWHLYTKITTYIYFASVFEIAITPVTGLNRTNTGKEDDDDDALFFRAA